MRVLYYISESSLDAVKKRYEALGYEKVVRFHAICAQDLNMADLQMTTLDPHTVASYVVFVNLLKKIAETPNNSDTFIIVLNGWELTEPSSSLEYSSKDGGVYVIDPETAREVVKHAYPITELSSIDSLMSPYISKTQTVSKRKRKEWRFVVTDYWPFLLITALSLLYVVLTRACSSVPNA